ncbi:MAG: GTPase, partial [Planctomycetota bacterium]
EARVEASAARHLREVLRPKLPPCAPVTLPETSQGKPHVVAFVGPTGVGKTTTIAKLAAPLRVVHNRRVALVTLDTFRLGAVEQITRYAEIVGIDVHAVERPEHLRRVVDSLSDHDVIFVDTAGTSPKNEDQLHHIQQSLVGLEHAQIHLCLPASRSRAALLEAAENYRPLGYDRLLITKGDESVGAGQLLDLFQVARVPVSYITNGQNVPEDVATATSERLESLMLGVSS